MNAIGRRLVVVVGLATSAVLGCTSTTSEAGDSFPSTPVSTVKSQSGQLEIAAYTAPQQPPTRGTITVKLAISDGASGKSVDGLTIAMAPEMPSMGHGTPIVPKISGKGGGKYIAEDVNLFMPGRWDLRMTISGAANDDAIVPVDVR